jgi:hypothetical protein
MRPLERRPSFYIIREGVARVFAGRRKFGSIPSWINWRGRRVAPFAGNRQGRHNRTLESIRD